MNLVLVDEEHRRYFKQQEITIFRRRGKEEHEKIPMSPAAHALGDDLDLFAVAHYTSLFFIVDDGLEPEDDGADP